MATPEERHPARRIVVRRSRGGAGSFSAGGARAAARSMGTPRDIGDAVDDAIDPENPANMNDRVRRIAPAAPQAGAPGEAALALEHAGASHAVTKEYRLTMLHKMMMRRIPVVEMARALGVSVSTIEKDRVELKKRLRDIAREMNTDELIGEGMEFYDDISSMALRIASRETGETAVPTAMRLAAMRTAVTARGDKSRFMQTAGVFDVLRFRQAESSDALSDVQALMSGTDSIIEQLLAEDNEKKAARRGGFKEFSSEDPAEPEVMEV